MKLHVHSAPVTAALTALLAIALTPIHAGDWPGWRGPNRDGISTETGLLKTWPEGGPKLLWEAEGCGQGYSSVAIAGGNVYTLGKTKDGEALFAFSAADGKPLWSTVFGGGGHSNGSPQVDGELVYAIGLAGDLVCARTASGEVVWKKNFAKDFGGVMMSGWGFSESPLIDGDRLICTPGGPEAMMVALDKKTGAEIWRSPTPADLGQKGKDGAGYSSVVISNGAGVKQYIQITGRGAIGVRAGDGKPLWHYNKVANGTANIPTPLIDGDYVFCSTGYGTGSALLKLAKDGDGVKAEEQYFLDGKVLQNHHGGMILKDGHIYMGHAHNNGFPVCVELKTGKIVWGGDQRGPGAGSAAVLLAGDDLIFRYEDGVVAQIEATTNGYNLKSQFKPAFQKGKSWAHPVIVDGRLYLREQEKLMCYAVGE
jgi:outer membrane protein assembly factor BamB